jgi:hypothetical protein
MFTLVSAIGINDVLVKKKTIQSCLHTQHCNYVGIIIRICIKMVVLLIHRINVAML